MCRRHADNWSHPGQYLVDPYTWPWSQNGHGHGHEWPTATPFVQCQPALPFWETTISKFDHENPWSKSCVWSKVKVTVDLENSKVKVMVKVKPDGHIWGLGVQSICLLFFSWQSDHFWLRYSKLYIWPWKFKVKVMAKVKPDGHIWAVESNWYVCFSFRGNRTIFGWDIANSILTLKNLGQGHDENRLKSNQVIYRSGPTIVRKMKEIQKVIQKLSREQESAAGGGAGGGVRTGTKT